MLFERWLEVLIEQAFRFEFVRQERLPAGGTSINGRAWRRDMSKKIQPGDCVKLPDGRTARVRDAVKGVYRVRVRRKTSKTHQFLKFEEAKLGKVACPEGWMSPEGYNRYLKATLSKMRARNGRARSRPRPRATG